MRSTFAVGLLLAGLLMLAYGVHSGRIVVPDEWNPWAPLKIEQPLHWLTRIKLDRLSRDDALCSSVLGQAQMRHQAVPDRDTGRGCGFRNAVRIVRTSFSVEPFVLSCRSAVALALWELHIVRPAAQAHFFRPVVRIEHFGSYACRNVYGRDEAPLSRHATADALDVAAFVIEGGRRISVERDWPSESSSGQFLRDVHQGACRVFDAVLGPNYNAEHRNHFHMDRGGYRVCR